MKIGFVVGTLGRGGAEKQLLHMLRVLHEAAMEVSIVCLTRGEAYEAEIRALGVDVEYVGRSGNRLIRLWRIVQALRRQRCDIIQSSHFYTNIYAALAGKLLRRPSIGAIRSNLVSELRIGGALGRLQLSLPTFLIVNNPYGLERARENGIAYGRIAYVHNAVDLPLNRVTPTPEPERPITLLFVGRLGPEKRPQMFVRLAARLTSRDTNDRFRFIMVGDGPLRDEVHWLAEELGVHRHVDFLGERNDLDRIYAMADILVSSSEYEGTPNAILEAMAWGVPVVATSVGGTPQILADGRGMLVSPDDEEELFSSTRSLIDDRKLRSVIAQNAVRYVAMYHSPERLQRHLLDIYRRLTNDLRDPLALEEHSV